MGQYGAYSGAPGHSDTDRYPSAAIWSKLDALAERPGRTFGYWDDMCGLVMMPTITTEIGVATAPVPYKMFGSSGATITQETDEIGGVWTLTEATDNESVSFATEQQPFRISTSVKKLIAFEARIKVSSIADTGSNFVIGLGSDRTLVVGDPIATTGALISTIDFVGFQRLEADGDQLEATYQAGGVAAVVPVANAFTLVADTFVKCGFLYDPDVDDTLRFFINGIELVTGVTVTAVGTAGPFDINLGFICAHMAAATTPGTESIDWWKCYQAA